MQPQMQSVNFSASMNFVPDISSMQYLNYGAAVNDVSWLLIHFFMCQYLLKIIIKCCKDIFKPHYVQTQLS